MKVDLSNQVAAVTGGGGVLCSCMAAALAECGARVAVLDLKPEAAEKAAAAIRAAGGKALGAACDALKKESLEQARARIEKEFGPITLLINGAGGNHPKGTKPSSAPLVVIANASCPRL
jgi:NAD(P)-dependent dehydrogenase (short-subunit alcohol dehydrogenase family)